MSNRSFEVKVVNKTKYPLRLININLDHGSVYKRGDETVKPGATTLVHVESNLFTSAEGDIWYDVRVNNTSMKFHIRMKYSGAEYSAELVVDGGGRGKTLKVGDQTFKCSITGKLVDVPATVMSYNELHCVATIE